MSDTGGIPYPSLPSVPETRGTAGIMRIAFDPGLVATGYAVATDGSLVISGTIRPKAELMAERLANLMNEVEGLCQSYKPLLCDIEVAAHFGYSRSTEKQSGKMLNTRSLILNGYATALILAVAGRYKVPVQERQAHTWKMAGRRDMTKSEMIFVGLFSLPVSQEDNPDLILARG